MVRPVTRALYRTVDGERRFVEITWIGHEVEAVTGRVGTTGRAQEKSFTSASERDAFIEKRVAKALRDGFVEGSPADTPDPPDPDRDRATALRKKHARSAYLPRVARGDDDRSVSKLGGTPWLPKGSTWPACPGCAQPLRFVLQLARNGIPDEMRCSLRDDLLQLFLCDSAGRENDASWIYQADGEGWRPFAPSTLVRTGRLDPAGPAGLHDALPVALLDLRRRRALEGLVAHCTRVGDPQSAARFAARLATESVTPRDYEV